ncbi:MAG: response regulator [Paracoccaceae bacterium]
MSLQSDASERTFTRALVVDDHPLFCDALLLMLKSLTDVSDARTASTLTEAFQTVEGGFKPDIIFLDLNLPDVDGLDGLVRLRNNSIAPIAVVSSMVGNRIVTSAIRAGASGFIPKHSQREVFAQAIDSMRKGHIFVPEDYVLLDDGQLGTTTKPDVFARISTLTNQQARILQLICEGKLNKQIAYDLSMSVVI